MSIFNTRKIMQIITGMTAVGILLVTGSARSTIIDVDTTAGNGADSYISSFPGRHNTNFGSEDAFFLKNDFGGGFVNRKGYLRFDLSSIADPITNANLALSFVEDTHITFATWVFNVYGLSDGHSGENWLETGITWNNAPANDTSSGGGLLGGQASLLGAFSIDTFLLAPGDIVNFSSSALTNFLQVDTNDLVTLILIRQDLTLSKVGFATKEHTDFQAPTLTLSTTVNPVPEPDTLLLMCLGLAGIGYWRYKVA